MTSTSTSITRLLSPLRLVLCGALSLGLVACVGGEKETDSSADSETSATDSDGTTGGTDGTSSSSASSTGGTDSGTDGSTGSGTDSDSAGGTSTSGGEDTTTGDSTTDSGTTGQANPGLETACGEACEMLMGCYPDEWPSLDACVQECVDGSGDQGEACEIAALDYLECMAGLTCVELEDDGCSEEEDAAIDACEGEVCSVGLGGGVGECGIVEDCGDTSRQMNCEGETCVCLVNDEVVDQCANDVCLDEEPDPDAIQQKALACCGFEL
jgi:hypothetical protein